MKITVVRKDGTRGILGEDRAKPNRLPWTPERTALLRKLWLSGHSASECAKHLGWVTRNAIIGKVTRMGLRRRSEPASPKIVTKSR